MNAQTQSTAAAQFNAWIERIKVEKNWTDQDLARHSGLAHSTISRGRKPGYKFTQTMRTLMSIARASGQDIPRELLTGLQDTSPPARSDVLAPSRRAPPSDGVVPQEGHLVRRTAIDDTGHIEIPPSLASALGGGPGEALVTRIVDGVLTIETVDNALRRARALVRRYVPEGVSLVDELIADRRAEAKRE